MNAKSKVLIGIGAILFALNVAIPYAAHLHLMKNNYYSSFDIPIDAGDVKSETHKGKILWLYEYRVATTYSRDRPDGRLYITTRAIRPFLPYVSATHWKLAFAPAEALVSMFKVVHIEVKQ